MRTSRRTFLTSLGAAAGLTLARPAFAQQPAPARQATTRGPRPFEFVFARLRYDSGDWDYNPKVAANVLDAVIQYTDIAVYPQEVVVPPDSAELAAFPFLFMTGHKLVRFNDKERANLIRFVDAGGVWQLGIDDAPSSAFRVTPGFGIRLATPLGPARLDVGFNPYERQPGALYQETDEGDLLLVTSDYSAPKARGYTIHFAVGNPF